MSGFRLQVHDVMRGAVHVVLIYFRLYARLKTKREGLIAKGIGADEYFGIVALVGNIIYSA